MKKILLLIAFAGFTIPASAQKSKKQNKQKEQPTTQSSAESKEDLETRKARVALAESRMMGPMHQMLVQFSGHWREEMKFWASPKSEPTITEALRDSRIFGEGRFLTSTIMGQMGNLPYEAQSVLGFDNAKRVFVKTWYDNTGTSILVLEGIYDEKSNTIDFNGFTNDPITKQPIKIHQVLKIIDHTTHLLEIYVEMKEGKEFKSMEVRSIRG
jgi:hypothetical protein